MGSFGTNITWSFFANIIYAASQWCIISAIAKTQGAAELGVYSLALAIAGPLFSFFNFNLRAVQCTDIRDDYSSSEYFQFRLLSLALAGISVCAVLLCTNYSKYIDQLIILVSLAKIAESLSDVIYGMLHRYEAMDIIAKSMIIRGFISAFLFSGSIILTDNLVLSVACIVITNLLVFCLYDIRSLKLIGIKLKMPILYANLTKYKVLSTTVIPLGFVIFCNTLSTAVPRYMLEAFVGMEALGIYAGLAYFLMVGATLVNAIGQSASPRLAKLNHTDKTAFYRLLYMLIFFVVFIGCIGIFAAYVFGDLVLGFVYSPEFSRHTCVLMWVMFGALLMYLSAILGVGLTSKRLFGLQSKISLIFLAFVGTFSYFFIINYGLMGAAYALFSSYSVKVLLTLIYFVKSEKDNLYSTKSA